MRRTSLATLALAALLSACVAVRPARMALPPALSVGAEQVAVTGIGGSRSGNFAVGPIVGSYTRSASRLALFDALYERREGRATFTLSGSGVNGKIAAECRMKERSVTLAVVSFTPKPMAYACEFVHKGRLLPARFEIQEARTGLAGALMLQERRGEIAFDRVVLHVRSVHSLEGSPIRMATPIGYVFEHGGTPVGAVEINGDPVVVHAAQSDTGTRRAVVIGAIALGIFWDPAESALGREAG
jgi:hypothetical protein